mgnify:CR=1 FL=1|tara:strand:- start:18273 stop:19607 length:1335 start_codon:yes stop_codon:yes gene_type:complete
MGILSDIVSNIETREGLPSVGGNFMENFKNTSPFSAEDLYNPTRIDPPGFIPDIVNLNDMQRETFGNFLANRPDLQSAGQSAVVDPTTDPLTESLTGEETMYGVPGAASAAIDMGGSVAPGGGLGANQAYASVPSGTVPVLSGGGGDGISLGGLGSLAGKIGSGVKTGADIGLFGLPAMGISRGYDFIKDKFFPEKPMFDGMEVEDFQVGAGGSLGATPPPPNPNTRTVGDLVDIIKARAAEGDEQSKAALAEIESAGSSSPFKFTPQGKGGGKTVRQSSAQTNAMDDAAMARDKAGAMRTLYGGAGSSFESGRDAYTESGQYDIDKARRDAEFDAMRAAERGNAPPLTREETARRLAELQASIGFGGVMAPANAPMSTRVEPNPVPTNFELVSGFNVPAPVTGLPSLSAVNETRMSPVERNRRARLGRGRMMMNYGGLATFGL